MRVAAPEHRGTLISDFTVDELVDELAAPIGLPALGAEVAPYGQVTQFLMQPPAAEDAQTLRWSGRARKSRSRRSRACSRTKTSTLRSSRPSSRSSRR